MYLTCNSAAHLSWRLVASLSSFSILCIFSLTSAMDVSLLRKVLEIERVLNTYCASGGQLYLWRLIMQFWCSLLYTNPQEIVDLLRLLLGDFKRQWSTAHDLYWSPLHFPKPRWSSLRESLKYIDTFCEVERLNYLLRFSCRSELQRVLLLRNITFPVTEERRKQSVND